MILMRPQYESVNDERLQGVQWQAVKEVWGAFTAFAWGDEKYCIAFGRDIIESIPPGSIYFGGTDPGRFLVTALCKSQVNADPFYILTQNALADGGYLAYLRGMYGDKIYTPTDADSETMLSVTTRRMPSAAVSRTNSSRERVSGWLTANHKSADRFP